MLKLFADSSSLGEMFCVKLVLFKRSTLHSWSLKRGLFFAKKVMFCRVRQRRAHKLSAAVLFHTW